MSLTQAAFGCAPLGRTSCGGQSALPRHCVPGFISLTPAACRLRSAGAHFVRRPVGLASALRAGIYIAHASSLSAALRGGALRATASRPCLGTACRDLYRSRPAACRLRSAGAHFVRRPVGLASALRAGIYIAHASSLSAALRGGALRATASRPCLGTACLGLECFNNRHPRENGDPLPARTVYADRYGFPLSRE